MDEEIYSTSNPPEGCRNGHPFGPYRVIVSFQHCSCSRAPHLGHTAWKCVACGDVIYAHGHRPEDDGLFFY